MADGTEGGGPLTEMFEVRLPASMVRPRRAGAPFPSVPLRGPTGQSMGPPATLRDGVGPGGLGALAHRGHPRPSAPNAPDDVHAVRRCAQVLPKAVADFWRAEEMCDAQLLVQGQIFNAHRLVLAAASTHFATAFKAPDDIPLEVEGSPEAVSVLLEYLYVGKVSVSEAMLEQMRVLAEQLALSSLLSDVRAIIATKVRAPPPLSLPPSHTPRPFSKPAAPHARVEPRL